MGTEEALPVGITHLASCGPSASGERADDVQGWDRHVRSILLGDKPYGKDGREAMEPNVAGIAKGVPPEKVLFVHTPKAGGSNLIETFTQALGYRRLQSRRTDTEGVWHDFEVDDLAHLVTEPDGFISTHTLSFGWSRLVSAIPDADRDEIAETVRQFRQAGWFIFTAVRHPGDLLCSLYHYILDHHRRGHLPAVALHVPAVGIPLDVFIAAHCHQPLLPDYWSDFDDCLITGDDSLTDWFFCRFGHMYQPVTEWRHASGSRGYDHYCATGDISTATQGKLDRSAAMKVYRDILDNRVASSGPN